MRLLAWALTAVAAAGCHRAADDPSAPAPTPAVTATTPDSPAVTRPTPTATPASTSSKLTLPGIFKPIPERSTDDLIVEVEAPGTRDRLPLLAELAKRTADADRIRPTGRKLMLDGRYAVRVAAAMAVVALDAEHPGPTAADLVGAIGNRTQVPVYGPLVETTPELRQIQALAVPGLAKAIERETDDPKREHTPAALSILGTMPADVGRPALAAVRRVAGTETHPNRNQARAVLKTWGAE